LEKGKVRHRGLETERRKDGGGGNFRDVGAPDSKKNDVNNNDYSGSQGEGGEIK